MTTDLHLDGNGMAGLLAEIAGADLTSAMRTCQSCGDRHAIGNHRAYRGAGIVLRCPGCEAVAATIGVREEHLVVRWQGTLALRR